MRIWLVLQALIVNVLDKK